MNKALIFFQTFYQSNSFLVNVGQSKIIIKYFGFTSLPRSVARRATEALQWEFAMSLACSYFIGSFRLPMFYKLSKWFILLWQSSWHRTAGQLIAKGTSYFHMKILCLKERFWLSRQIQGRQENALTLLNFCFRTFSPSFCRKFLRKSEISLQSILLFSIFIDVKLEMYRVRRMFWFR